MSKKKDSPGAFLKEQAAKLGIPKEGATFDTRALHVVWVGSGVKCAEIVSSVDKKALADSFLKREPKASQDDPIVERFRDHSESKREYVFRKEEESWRSTLLMEHNLGRSSDKDTATIVFFLEEI